MNTLHEDIFVSERTFRVTRQIYVRPKDISKESFE
jgi:hypothetical protein